MTMKFTDTATLHGTRRTDDGYLVTEAFAVRTGIQHYSGAEVGLFDRDVVAVYRPEEEVRSPASLATFSHAPVTLGHPSEGVTKDNWATLAKGEVSTEATWDGNKIKLPLIVKDTAAIAAIDAGTRELSAGYTCELDFVDGVTPQGEPYNAIQRNIKINHLAIVPQGRAGSECRIGDNASHWGLTPCPPTSKQKDNIMPDALKTVVLGDQAVQVAVTDAATIEKFKTDAAKALSDLETSHTATVEARDATIGELKVEVQALKDAATTPEKLSKMVADRVSLETAVKAIDDKIKLDGVADADLRKAAVASKLGDEMVADASEGEISGMFKAVSKDAAKGVDTFADSKRNASPQTQQIGDNGQSEYEAGLTNAWKTPVAGGVQ